MKQLVDLAKTFPSFHSYELKVIFLLLKYVIVSIRGCSVAQWIALWTVDVQSRV